MLGDRRECGGNSGQQIWMGSSSGFAQKRLYLAPHHFDRVEVRRVGWKEANLGTGLLDQGQGVFVFVRSKVIHHDDIAWSQGGHERLADVGAETSVFVAPSIVMQALVPSERTEEIMVVVRQWPCGAWPTSRSPLGARPRSRVMLVLAADSSMKTSRAGSSPLWPRRHRRRALATFSRFCSAAWSVFFYMSVPSWSKPS